MLQFEEINLSDYKIYSEFIKNNKLLNCESPFTTIFFWQDVYENKIAVTKDNLFLKSGNGKNPVFRLPLGENRDIALKEIFDFCGSYKPFFWICEDEIKDGIPEILSEKYNFYESRDDFDYIYLRDNLATLSGKKYHSKRNHISAFSKKYDWHYERITKDNAKAVKLCASKWYSSRECDKYLLNEKKGIDILLSNLEELNIIGGAIYVDGAVVAFTLGAELNSDVFVTHIEKALPEYAESYTVINYEFAKNELSQYKYINREDDMGIEGVRKAKLSYKPEILLKKYYCTPKSETEIECREIYNEAFGTEDKEFADALFKNCFKYCKFLKKQDKTVAILFLLPCELKTDSSVTDAYYLFAAATKKEYRGKGYMSELLEEIKKESKAPIFLRPAQKSLIEFYEKSGFALTCAQNSDTGEIKLLPKDEFKLLESFADTPDNSEFDFMVYGKEIKGKINFRYSFD